MKTTFSRRELYALGEPIGDCATISKVGGGRIYGMGGGGGGSSPPPAPTQQTVTQTNIPDWLRPQVETTLGGAMQQLFQTSQGADGTQTITGVKPYTPYGAGATGSGAVFNPMTGQYDFSQGAPGAGAGAGSDAMQTAQAGIAGYSPLQQQAMQGVAGLGLPSTYGQAADIAGQGIGGLFGTAGQARGLFGMGRQAAGAGQQYAMQATDPYATQAYMSPYLNAALAPQIALQQQQQGIQANQLAGQATQAGAFGGSRYGIQQGLQNQANQLALQNLMGQGYNQAFNQAQQAQQFGAGLGLQGLQTGAGIYNQGIGAQQQAYNQAIQGANQLAGIGGQALGAQSGILGLQNQIGAMQQQQQQNIINQAIQNYATAQQFPLQQYNAYNALLRGYAVPGSTTTTYQAAPSMASQLAGLGTAGIAAAQLAKLPGAKKGGAVKRKAGVGIDSLAIKHAMEEA